ncbi:hypothetical protein BDB01DRAFT_718301, partial [Pilobolus umbonatus]
KYYTCNRQGTYKKSNDDNSGAVQRTVQKKSKKIGFPATLKVTCFKNDPDNVVIKHNGEHNHAVGSLDNLRHLPLSSSVREKMEQILRKGYARRDTRISIQRSLLEEVSIGSFVHRDQLISAHEVYNISKRIGMEVYKKAEDQLEIIKLYFGFGFVSPWQKELLLAAENICLDATYKTTNIKNGVLHSIVVRHPLTGTGCPVAFFFTTHQSMWSLS